MDNSAMELAAVRTQESEIVAGLLARLHALAPMVAAQRTTMETERRLPTALFSALGEAGLFRLWLPRALGGPELSPFGFQRLVEAAAMLDGSVGWVVGNAAGSSRIAGYLAREAAEALFGDPHALMVTATGTVGQAVPVEGGWRVTGRWPFGSGIHGATSASGLCAIEAPCKDDAPRMIMCCVPISAVRIVDTWQVSGLRGTGSCDWILQDAFVPEAFAFGFPEHRPTQQGAVYRMPVISSFGWSVSVVPLGIARAALNEFVLIARDKVRVGTTQRLQEREVIQTELGRADAMLRSARALLVEAMLELVAAVDGDETELLVLRATLRQAAAHAAETALRIATMLEGMAGTAAIRETSQLPRRLRDLRASVQHVAMSPNYFAVAGRLLMGMDAGTSRV